MKILIKYYSIDYGASMFASPTYHNQEIVEVDNDKQLDNYITNKKDPFGHKYKKDKSYGYDYISNMGAVKTEKIQIKKIK